MSIEEAPKPVPDPTVLTADAIDRSAKSERDYANGQLGILRERLEGMDRANVVLSETVTRTPTEIQREVGHLREVMNERSKAVDEKFHDAEKLRQEQKSDTRAAVDAALAAAKEAVREQTLAFQLATNKSELAIGEQLKQLNVTFTSAIRGQSEALSDAKDRIGRMESLKQGGQDNTGRIVVAITIAVLIIGLIISFANFVTRGGP